MIEQITKIDIDAECHKSLPCVHKVTITANGRTYEPQLMKCHVIACLFDIVHESKIDGNVEHFQCSPPYSYLKNAQPQLLEDFKKTTKTALKAILIQD